MSLQQAIQLLVIYSIQIRCSPHMACIPVRIIHGNTVFQMFLYGRGAKIIVVFVALIVVLGLIPSPSQNGTTNHIPWSISMRNVWDSSK